MNKLTQQPTYTHHRNQTRACTCYSPEVTAFLTHAKAAHRATQQLQPPSYFKAAYAITRQELATLISDSRHTTPGLRLGVAFAMSSHVTGSKWTVLVATLSSITGLLVGFYATAGDDQAVYGPIYAALSACIITLGYLLGHHSLQVRDPQVGPVSQLIHDIASLTGLSYDDFLKTDNQAAFFSGQAFDMKQPLLAVLIRISTILHAPVLPGAGIRAARPCDDMTETLARLPDTDAWDKPSTALNALAAGFQVYLYLLSLVSFTDPLSDSTTRLLAYTSVLLNCIVKPITRLAIPTAQYNRELVKHFWHSYLSFVLYSGESGDAMTLAIIRCQACFPDIPKTVAAITGPLDYHSIVQLIRLHGNQAIQLFIADAAAGFPALTALHEISPPPGFVQSQDLPGYYTQVLDQLITGLNRLQQDGSVSPIQPDIQHMMEDHSQFTASGRHYIQYLSRLLARLYPSDSTKNRQCQSLDISFLSKQLRSQNARYDTALAILNHIVLVAILTHKDEPDDATIRIAIQAYAVVSLIATGIIALVRNALVVKNGETYWRILGDDLTPLSALRVPETLANLLALTAADIPIVIANSLRLRLATEVTHEITAADNEAIMALARGEASAFSSDSRLVSLVTKLKFLLYFSIQVAPQVSHDIP